MRPDLEELSPRQWAKTIWLDHHCDGNDGSGFHRMGRNQRFAKHLLGEANLKLGYDYLIINDRHRIGITLATAYESFGSWIVLTWPRYKDAT